MGYAVHGLNVNETSLRSRYKIRGLDMARTARKRKAGGGRKPIDQKAKAATLPPVRVAPELRARLESETKGGRPLSRVIESRLWDSYRRASPTDWAGNYPNAGLAVLIAQVARGLEVGTGKSWRTDPFTANALRVAVAALLDEYGAKGESVTPDRVLASDEQVSRVLALGGFDPQPPATFASLGMSYARGLIESVANTPRPPAPKAGVYHADQFIDLSNARDWLAR
jgi:hypothetical protein